MGQGEGRRVVKTEAQCPGAVWKPLKDLLEGDHTE